jgi:NAD(P)-dependent dehydrogenase (short-subunit alcohol dehydrogenase family)
MTAEGRALAGRRALVTGASRGLGRAIVEALWSEGADIVAVARPSHDLDALAAALPERCEPWPMDVTGDAILERIAAGPPLDILVNNAGTNVPKPVRDVTDDDLDRMIDLNVRATFRLSRAALATMPAGGAIVNITSQMGHVGSPDRSVYCMTKHAIEGLTKAMAVELAPSGIRVNAVAPTFVETPMTRPMLDKPDFKAFVEGMIPMGRVATPHDVSAAVVYLCSPGAGMVTGHSLVVDGGWTAQ